MVSTPSGLDPVFYKTFIGARKKENQFNAVELWWFDCSAKALMNNYRDFTKSRFQAESINKLDHNKLEPGDFAVTVDGVHTLVYLGNKQWIEADPGIGKVITVTVPVENNGWFDLPVQILSWQ